MEAKKIKVGFREVDFYNDNNTFANIDDYRKKIDCELKRLLDDAPKIKDYERVSVDIYAFLEDKHRDNNHLKLTGQKLAELTGVDTSQLIQLEKKLKDIHGDPNMKEPKAEDYTIYAETPEEIERYEDCLAFIKILNKFRKAHGLNAINPVSFIPMIDYNLNTQEFEPNPYFIKKQ